MDSQSSTTHVPGSEKGSCLLYMDACMHGSLSLSLSLYIIHIYIYVYYLDVCVYI